MLLAQVPFARRWLEQKRPSGDGPDAATRERGWFRFTVDVRAGKRSLVAEVSGGDPGYGETSKMLAECGLCLALDAAQLPERYGVLTTAEAMGDALLARLTRAGIGFEVITSRGA